MGKESKMKVKIALTENDLKNIIASKFKCDKQDVLLEIDYRSVGQFDSESYIRCEIVAEWREDESLNEAGKKGGATTS